MNKSYLAASTMCLVGQEAEDSELQESSEIHEIPVVRAEWVLHSVRCKQRLPISCFQAPFGDDQAGQVFGHLSICLGGINEKDKQSLWALIISKGGNVTFELNKQTTHLVVGAASGPKYFEALKRNGTKHTAAGSDESKNEDSIKIVTPDWVTQCIQKKSRLLEKPFHPRLMTLPGQPVTQPRPRRPKHRVKPRQVQLPVGPTRHSTRLTTPVTAQKSGAPGKSPTNPLLLKQLQGGNTPTGITSQGRFSAPVVTSSKSSLPPPPTLPMSRVSLASPPNTPVQARKSAPVPVANSSATAISITSSSKSNVKPSATTTSSPSVVKTSVVVTSPITALPVVSNQAKSSNAVPSKATSVPSSKTESNTFTTAATTHTLITATKSPATTITTAIDPNTSKVVVGTKVTPTKSPVVSATTETTSAIANSTLASATTTVTNMATMVNSSCASQNITSCQGVTITSAPRAIIAPSGASIQLPQTPVSMSTAQMLAGQKPLPPASLAAPAQTLPGTSPGNLPTTSTFGQITASNVSATTNSFTNTKPAVLQQQQQPMAIQSLSMTQANTITLPQQATTTGPTAQLSNQQTMTTNLQGQTPLVNQNQQVPPVLQQQQMQPQMQNQQQIQPIATALQPGQQAHSVTPGNLQTMQPGQQAMQPGQGMGTMANQQWNQQQWQGTPTTSFPQQQQWQQSQQPMTPGQIGQQIRPRQVTPHMVQQQQIIQRHIASLTLEQRNAFTQMPAREKQIYLHQRGLLLSPQRPMLALTEQQKEMLQAMDPQQKAAFIEKLRKEAHMRQMMIQQRQMAQQQQGQQAVASQGQPIQQNVGGSTVNSPQQMQQWGPITQGAQPQQFGQNVRGPSHTSPQPMQVQQQISPSGSITPPNNRMQIPTNMQIQGQNRPQWSGETHPALAQVPRTPQQLQHLQRLQLQREQQLEQQQMLPQQRPQTPVSMSPLGSGSTSGQQSPVGPQMTGPPQSPQVPQSPQAVGQMQQQFMQPTSQMGQPISTMPQGAVGIGQSPQSGSVANPNQKTKAALASMINSRLQQPQTPTMTPGGMSLPGAIQQQPMPAAPPPQQMPPQMSPQNVGGGSPSMDASATSRLQMMNQQLQHQLPGQAPPPGAAMIGSQQSMVGQPPAMFAQQQRQQLSPQQHQQYLAMSQQRRALEAMGQRGPIPPQMTGSPVSPHSMGPRFIGPRGPVGMQPPHMRPGMAGITPLAQRQPVFYGHDPTTVGKLPPEYCLLGCIFYIIDYQNDQDESKYVRDWKKVIRQFGGEVEDAYHPRITHLMCKNQDSSISGQALREGKRLVTVYWLNDVVVLRKVVPPWKGVHFPLPADFDEPCKHMILTITGFEGRDRDWVKDMIKLSGAKYTSYFTRHNHAIVCKSPDGEKYNKAKEWKVPTVSVQWLNEVLFGNVNGAQVMNNPKFQNFKLEDPFKMEYALVPNLIAAWKNPIGVTRETYQKFKANPPTRLKRKAENLKAEEEGAKRLKLQEEQTKGISEASSSKSNESDTEVKVENGEYQANQVNTNGEHNGVTYAIDQEKIENRIDENENQSNIKKELDGDGMEMNTPNILFTGFVPSSLSEMERMARLLGANVVTCQNASKATHMVMPKLGRTMAFLCGITYVKYILSSTWIEDSNKEKKFLGK